MTRRLFVGNITTWGPTANKWLLQHADVHHCDGYALQETHVAAGALETVESDLGKAGFKACFTAARSSTSSTTGSYGGTAVVMRGHLQTSSFRCRALSGAVSAATTDDRAGSHQQQDLNMLDWTPISWHLRGTTLTVVSIYLDSGGSLEFGINARKLATLKAFLSQLDTPWMICGD